MNTCSNKKSQHPPSCPRQPNLRIRYPFHPRPHPIYPYPIYPYPTYPYPTYPYPIFPPIPQHPFHPNHS
jgi:hypothetical protein